MSGDRATDDRTENRVEAPGDEPVSMFNDAEMVIYTTDVDDVEFEPETEWAKELDITAFSLWARFEEAEIPLWSQSEQGSWLSLRKTTYSHEPADPVSGAFIECVATLVDEDMGGGWGGVEEEPFNEMADAEKMVFGRIRMALHEQQPPEAIGVLEWCRDRYSEESDD